jgi:hypothetical protein
MKFFAPTDPQFSPWQIVFPEREITPNRCFRKFSKRVRERLADLDDERGDLKLISVGLSFPEPPDPASVYESARLFATKIARKEGGTVFLAIDFSEKTGRPHWHGLVVTRESNSWLRTTWSDLTAGRAGIKSIAGQESGWAGEDLRGNLNSVVRYALKPQSGPVEIPPDCWVVASGFLRREWLLATGIPTARAGTKLVRRSTTSPSTVSGASQGVPGTTPSCYSQETIQSMGGELSYGERGGKLRDCRNHKTCHGIVLKRTAQGRTTRKDCTLCDACADARDKKYDHLGDGHRTRSSDSGQWRDGGIDGPLSE